MNIINLIQTKNKILSPLFPKAMARQAGNLFFTPMQGPMKDWEKEAESKGRRETYEYTAFLVGPHKCTALFRFYWMQASK